jgi:glycosyltransferase involved in cell wall biosynthesis
MENKEANMSYRITFYCPDKHISFDGHTPDREGIGGGLTARIRLARALARRGHRVTMVAFTPREAQVDGVHYLPVDQVQNIETDILILSSSGDKLSLEAALNLQIKAKLRIAWVHGTPKIGGLHEVPYDFLYTPSNFIRRVVQLEWGLPPSTRLFVSYNGIESSFFESKLFSKDPTRNPFHLVYMGHPNKGLKGALGVFRILRELDPRYQLHIYGGDGLYGAEDQGIQPEPGLFYHGTVGQKQLCRELKRYGFGLNLQDVREAYGISMMESMKAGCIVIASPAGAYPELIHHGKNGFLIPGDHLSQEVHQSAADLIKALIDRPDLSTFVQEHGVSTPLDTDRMAAACEGHWRWALGDKTTTEVFKPCPECGSAIIGLADGYHCTGCGRYDQGLSQVS